MTTEENVLCRSVYENFHVQPQQNAETEAWRRCRS